MSVESSSIVEYVRETFEGVDIQQPSDGPGAGDTFFIYDPHRDLEPRQQMPFATIVTSNYADFDEKSDLDRPGVYRLNVGVSRETFRKLFPHDDDAVDYAQLDRLIPHPVYASQSWVSVLNPSDETFEAMKPLLAEAYSMAVRRLARR